MGLPSMPELLCSFSSSGREEGQPGSRPFTLSGLNENGPVGSSCVGLLGHPQLVGCLRGVRRCLGGGVPLEVGFEVLEAHARQCLLPFSACCL